MKIIVVFVVAILFGNLYTDFLFAQELSIDLKPTKISGNIKDSCLSITIKNNSLDTILISLDPLNTDIVSSYEYRLFQTFPYYYQPNRILFFKIPSTGYFEALSSSNISFLKFPRILVIAPKNLTKIIITLGENILKSLKDNNWEIQSTICYAFKKEIFNALSIKSEYLRQEFENSLVEKESIKLDLMGNDQIVEKHQTKENGIRESAVELIQISDPSLYYYKNSSYSKDTMQYRSSYDSIIYLFNHTL